MRNRKRRTLYPRREQLRPTTASLPTTGDQDAMRNQGPDQVRDQGREAPLVLIVDDERPIAEVLETILQDAGYRVACAPHGEAALRLARSEPPAMVLTDLMMPVMDGKQLIARLHEEAERGNLPPAPVVVMTAMGRVHTRDLKVDGVLRKPFDLCEVEELVGRFLGERGASYGGVSASYAG
jgi:CheY-like chemotaxis protein